MTVLKTYTANKIEIEKDGYYDNNTAVIENGKTPYHFYDTGRAGLASVTYYMYQLDETQLRLGIISEKLINEYVGSIEGTIIYLDSQVFASEGFYRFHIQSNKDFVYTDIFCIKTITFGAVEKMKSGVLKVYKGDYFEYQKDGYFENNTLLNFDYQIAGVKFDSELDISSKTIHLYEINREKLRSKIFSEAETKAISASNTGSTIYWNNDYFQGVGIYRYKIIVRPAIGPNVDFYTDCFCVNIPDNLVNARQFTDDSFRQFASGSFREFAI